MLEDSILPSAFSRPFKNCCVSLTKDIFTGYNGGMWVWWTQWCGCGCAWEVSLGLPICSDVQAPWSLILTSSSSNDFQEIYWHMSTNPNAHGVNHHYVRRLQTQILKGEPRWHWWWCRNLGVIRWYTWYQATHRFCEFISNSTVYKQYREL